MIQVIRPFLIYAVVWYGNISPFEQCTRGDNRLKELLKLVARNRRYRRTDARIHTKRGAAQGNTPTKATPEKKFEPYKGKIRKSGTGCVTMINDHLYEGRFTPRVNGKRISKNVYAKTREECEEKLAELIKTMKAEIAEKKKAKQA
jgi:hypothetical protein